MQQTPSLRIQQLMAGALRQHQAGRLGDAASLYRQVLQLDPHFADALHLLGVLNHQVGRNDVAIELIGQAIAHNDRMPAYHNNLGNAFKAQGRLDAAVGSYERALAHKPDYPEAHYNLGVTLEAQGKPDEASEAYRRTLALKPNHADAHNNLGNVLKSQGRLEEAAVAYRHALASRPGYVEAHINLGNVLKARGQPDQALSSYGQALALRPNSAEAHNNMGLVLLEQSKLDESAAAFGHALRHKPDYAEAHYNLGNVLQQQGKAAEAAAAYTRALELQPDYAEARLGLAIAVIPVFSDTEAQSREAEANFARSIDQVAAWDRASPGLLGRAAGTTQPFFLAYRPVDVTASLIRYGDLICAAAAEYWHGNSNPTHPARDRVRLVIVSGQVRHRHPVWDVVLRGLVSHLNRNRFEVLLYHTVALVDDETEWARAHVDRFVQGPLPTRAWLAEFARDQPDVVFYPEVGMDSATCALAALRLAPLQIAGWGHPVTTGLPTMDLFVSGELLEGQGAERHYREKLIRLPGTGVCTELGAINPQPWQGPESSPDVVRFTLCHQPIKFDPADDVILTRIAKAVGRCEFWIAAPDRLAWTGPRLHGRLAAAFRAAGLDPDTHLRVLPWLPRNQFAGFLDAMDIYLDCLGFSGYTTAWQAIHRGVPIVTTEGTFLRQRLAAGLLRQIGVTDGIASSHDEYVNIAVSWARECRGGDRLAQRREAIRQAARKADGNLSSVTAFENAVLEHLPR
jgi:predicted O-linked N-acetylglucosamine transferase (SPINDLY family)